MKLKFAPGQTWRRHDGLHVIIQYVWDAGIVRAKDRNGIPYTAEGYPVGELRPSPGDLVELVENDKPDHTPDVDERLRNALIAKIAQAESVAKEAREAADELAQRLLTTAATNDNLARDLRAVLDSLSKPL